MRHSGFKMQVCIVDMRKLAATMRLELTSMQNTSRKLSLYTSIRYMECRAVFDLALAANERGGHRLARTAQASL
jgi:hypothetical protein